MLWHKMLAKTVQDKNDPVETAKREYIEAQHDL